MEKEEKSKMLPVYAKRIYDVQINFYGLEFKEVSKFHLKLIIDFFKI